MDPNITRLNYTINLAFSINSFLRHFLNVMLRRPALHDGTVPRLRPVGPVERDVSAEAHVKGGNPET